MEELQIMGKKAKIASKALMRLSPKEKNEILVACSREIAKDSQRIMEANKIDFETARKKGLKDALLDRLMLNEDRIASIAQAIFDISKLEHPIGEIEYMKELENGLTVGKKRVPIGVIGIIYESRPNVSADAFSLCFKAGNVCILKGGSDAFNSNYAIVEIIRDCIQRMGYNPDFLQLVKSLSREAGECLMKMNDYLDLLIPRGGHSLIQSVVKNATVPVIETGTGNCHIFVDETADLDKAVAIILNAKTQRPGTCNSLEKLLVHEKIAKEFLPVISKKLAEYGVEIRACQKSLEYCEAKLASESDWFEEYLDLIIAIKIVSHIDDAIEHIGKYSSSHSEAILTESYRNSQKFLNEVDSAAVYVNASTRFTDGFEFGFGAEIGISTKKIHARGPMGLKDLTTSKYIIYGNGQTRQ